jgi:hypothetical protein
MQTRKIVVEIKTIDDEHCDNHCLFWAYSMLGTGRKCSLFLGDESYTKKDSTGYLRTAACRKGEVKG